MEPFFTKVRQEVEQQRGQQAPRLLDIFSGTGIVSQFGRSLGFDATSNDIQLYSTLTARTLLLPGQPQLPEAPLTAAEDGVPSRPTFGLGTTRLDRDAERLFLYLESLRAADDHPFVESYVEGGSAGRLYLSRENGLKAAGIRDEIERIWQAGEIDDNVHALLVACLLEGLDKVANTASVYGAYLKHIKRSAQQPLRMASPLLVANSLPAGRALQGDANTNAAALAAAGERFDLMYVDPPYNERQYASNYHLLETVARWDLDQFEPRGKTGLRPSTESSSPYCSKKTVSAAVLDLLKAAPADRVLFSYNNEGLIPHDELEEIFREAGYEPQTTMVEYKRFRADKDRDNRQYSGDTTTEYLIYGVSV